MKWVALIVWMIITLLLSLSLVGLLVVVYREDSACDYWKGDEGEASWMQVGKRLFNYCINE